MSRTSGTVGPATYEVSADIYANKTEGQVAYYRQYSDNYSTDMEFVTFKGADTLRATRTRLRISFSDRARLPAPGIEINPKSYFQAPWSRPLTVKDVEIGSIRRTSSPSALESHKLSTRRLTGQDDWSLTLATITKTLMDR